MVDSVSVRFKNTSVSKNAFKHSCTVECGNRLRVGVLVLNTLWRVGVCMSALLRQQANGVEKCENAGNGLRVKTQRVKLPKTSQKKAIFREIFEDIQKYPKIQ